MTDPLAPLRARFVERCRADLARLRSGVTAEEAALLIHRLAGAAGSFGFPDIGLVAARLDDSAREGRPLSDAELGDLISALEAGLPPEEI